MADLKLDEVVNEVVTELETEDLKTKKGQIALKVRHVCTQIETFQTTLARLKKETAETEEKLTKAQTKLTQLKAGNWEVLKQINPKGEQQNDKEKEI